MNERKQGGNKAQLVRVRQGGDSGGFGRNDCNGKLKLVVFVLSDLRVDE